MNAQKDDRHANEDNPEGTVEKILDAGGIVIVSPESVSMISEAVSSGKYTIVFNTGEKNTKYEKVVAGLESQGYLKTVSPEKIYDTVKEILQIKPRIKRSGDREKIVKRLEGII